MFRFRVRFQDKPSFDSILFGHGFRILEGDTCSTKLFLTSLQYETETSETDTESEEEEPLPPPPKADHSKLSDDPPGVTPLMSITPSSSAAASIASSGTSGMPSMPPGPPPGMPPGEFYLKLELFTFLE